MEKKIEVKLAAGLEARPVALFVQAASQFQSNIYVTVQNKKVNAKSIMGMMSLGVIEGEFIVISAEGEDEAEAVEALEKYLTDAE
ncbi:MAG: HPr family phosphocarrier protein [Vallitaleaceae bacterium]|nr:HPr family phosphocarrier protein [Vallitaleaceae bacterium]